VKTHVQHIYEKLGASKLVGVVTTLGFTVAFAIHTLH
jgi:hypothetical protein